MPGLVQKKQCNAISGNKSRIIYLVQYVSSWAESAGVDLLPRRVIFAVVKVNSNLLRRVGTVDKNKKVNITEKYKSLRRTGTDIMYFKRWGRLSERADSRPRRGPQTSSGASVGPTIDHTYHLCFRCRRRRLRRHSCYCYVCCN